MHLKLGGVLAVLVDQKASPDHHGCPAEYSQACNGTAVIVGSPISCIQNRTCLLLADNGCRDLQATGLRINLPVMVLMMWNPGLHKGWMMTLSEAGRELRFSVVWPSLFVFTCSALAVSALCGLVCRVELQSGQNQDAAPPDLHALSVQVLYWLW